MTPKQREKLMKERTNIKLFECEGCSRADKLSGKGRLAGLFDDRFCDTYISPHVWFRYGKICPLGDHYKTKEETEFEKAARIGQQKQGAGGRFIKGALGYNFSRGNAK